MSEKERLSRIRLVDQNRERRRGSLDTPTHQDGQVLAAANAVFERSFSGLDNDVVADFRRALMFGSSLQQEFNQGRGVSGLSHGVQEEIFYIYVADKLKFSSHKLPTPLKTLSSFLANRGLSRQGLVEAMALTLTRPRLSWPVSSRPELTATWDVVSGAVKRRYGGEGGRVVYGALLQVVHMAARLSVVININDLINTF